MRNSTFGYRCTTAAPPYVQQLHHWIFTLYHCLPRRSDVLEEVYFLNAHLLRDLKLLIIDNSEDCYFNDGNAEDCYFTDGHEDRFYFNADTSRKIATLSLMTKPEET